MRPHLDPDGSGRYGPRPGMVMVMALAFFRLSAVMIPSRQAGDILVGCGRWG
jgi:hypothetical protein